MTQQQRLIKEVIGDSAMHLTAEEVYMFAKRRMPSLALGTVYRNLKLMSETGLIRKLDAFDGAARYDKTAQRHDHLLCERCGAFIDIGCFDLTEMIESSTGARVRDYEVSILGLCPACVKSEIYGEVSNA